MVPRCVFINNHTLYSLDSGEAWIINKKIAYYYLIFIFRKKNFFQLIFSL